MEIEQINKYVGSKIKDYRKYFGLSQEELAKKIGVGKTTISNYEVGIRSPKKPQLIKLSEVFDVAIDDFFPQTDSTRINVSSTLSEINKISSQLEEPRQKIVLNTATNQLDEQNQEKKKESKIVSIKNEQEKFDLADLVDDSKVDWDKWVSFDGRPLTDDVKEAMKRLLGKRLEDK